MNRAMLSGHIPGTSETQRVTNLNLYYVVLLLSLITSVSLFGGLLPTFQIGPHKPGM